MGIEFNKGFFIFDKSWFQNEFMVSLSHAEFRIMIYLLSSALKLSKRDERFKKVQRLVDLYRINHLLMANVSQKTIADRCNVNRATIIRALKKFEEYGAVITMSDGENNSNHIYLLGVERQDKSGKEEYFFVDSIPIRSGKKLPDQTIKFIEDHYQDELFYYSDRIWGDLFGMKSGAEVEVVAA
jgi:hypothetical protein